MALAGKNFLHILAFAVLTLGAADRLPAQMDGPSPAPAEPGSDLEIQEVVIGKGGAGDLRAEIVAPKNATKPMPAVVWIHGGGWKGGTYRNVALLRLLAARGYFCISIQYRVVKTAQWPAQIEDCKLAVRWLRENAARYHVDPDRIAAAGASAGGHLAVCLGAMANVKEYEGSGGSPGASSAVQAVVDYYGPTDFVTPGIYSEQATKLTENLMGKPLAGNEALWKSGSPVFYVKAGAPPMLLIHGDIDGTIPLAQSTALAEALKKAGVPYEFIVVKRGGHGLGFNPKPNPAMQPGEAKITESVISFLDRHLKAAKS